MTQKALLQSAGDGTAVPQGYVGQVVTWTTPPSTQFFTPGAAITDWSNATITLSPGIWLITSNISYLFDTGATTGFFSITASITDSLNNIVQNQIKSLVNKSPASAVMRISNSVSFSFVSNITTTTTYKIRGSVSTGSSTGAFYNESSNYSEFFAVRIA